MTFWLSQEAKASSDRERAEAVWHLAGLYRDIGRHPRARTSPTLASYRDRIRRRLLGVRKEIRESLDERGPPLHASARLSSQTLPQRPAGTANGVDRARTSAEEPGRFGGRAGPPDWGPALVALIERTVVPDFWDVHGGPGTIVYYYPKRALVVRATSDVHHRVGRVLSDLRAAGN